MNWLNSTPDATWGELLAALILGGCLGYLAFIFAIEPWIDRRDSRRLSKQRRKEIEEIGLIISEAAEKALIDYVQRGAHAQYSPWADDAEKRGLW